MEVLVRQAVERECSVIPVILDTCSNVPDLPLFLKSLQWVDFRVSNPDPMQRLIWGITGRKPPIKSGTRSP
jgi:hypothetical protein